MHFYLMRKNSHDKILKRDPKEQYLSTVPKSCSNLNIVGSHFLYFVNSLKNFIRILLGIKCKLSI